MRARDQMAWARRRAREDNLVVLANERLRRRGELAAELSRDERLDALLAYLRAGAATGRAASRGSFDTPAGRVVTYSRRGARARALATCAGRALGLELLALEVTPELDVSFHFRPHTRDNCQLPIVLEIEWRVAPEDQAREPRMHRMRGVRAGEGDQPALAVDATSAHELVPFIGSRALAVWVTRTGPHAAARVHLLWSSGAVLSVSRTGNTVALEARLALEAAVAPINEALALAVASTRPGAPT